MNLMRTWDIVLNVAGVQYSRRKKMKNSRFYFLLGFMSAMLFATVFVGCTAPLEAGSSECGDAEWNPCYVKIVE